MRDCIDSNSTMFPGPRYTSYPTGARIGRGTVFLRAMETDAENGRLLNRIRLKA